MLDDYHLADGAGDRERRGVPARPPPSAGAPGDQHPGRPGPAPGPAARRAASSSRCARPTSGSRLDEVAAYLNDVVGLGSRGRRRRRPGGPHRGLDRRPSSSRPCRCEDGTTPPGSSPASPGTTGTSSTTSSRRCSRASPRPSAPSCSRPRSSTGLSGPLCDAVTGVGRRQGRARVARPREPVRRPARRQSPVVPLPPPVRRRPARASARGAARASVAGPARAGGRLVRRARRAGPAVRHALAAGDVEPGGRPRRALLHRLLRNRQEATVRRWIDDIPDDVVGVRPVLAVGFIGALMSERRLRRNVERRLDESERLLGRPAGRRWSCSTRPSSPGCRARSQTYRAALALIGGDPAATVAHADRARDAARRATTSPSRRASALSGLASWGTRRPGGGPPRLLGRRRGTASAPGNISDVLGCSVTLADLEITQGRLRRRPAHLRGRAPARRGPRGRRSCCAARPTCSSA